MTKTVRVPEAFSPLFGQAEAAVGSQFADLVRAPEEGVVRIGGERYVLMRCESLFLAWFDALAQSFGEETARSFIYNTAREIGRGDSHAFSTQLSLSDPMARLAAGPVHFAHTGWARVELHDDCRPSPDDDYFLHYDHPNTFEAEVLLKRKRKTERPACLFSAGYSAGWCSDAFGLEVQAREIGCLAMGDRACEFIMAPGSKLDSHERDLRARQ